MLLGSPLVAWLRGRLSSRPFLCGYALTFSKLTSRTRGVLSAYNRCVVAFGPALNGEIRRKNPVAAFSPF